MKRFWFVVTAIMIFAICNQSIQALVGGVPDWMCSEGPEPEVLKHSTDLFPVNTSMYELLFFPEKYEGRFVWVEGYLSTDYEDSRLYLSKEDLDYFRNENSLWVSYGKKSLRLYPENRNIFSFSGLPVRIGGVFHKSNLSFVCSVYEHIPVPRKPGFRLSYFFSQLGL